MKQEKITFSIDAEIQSLQNKLRSAKKDAEWLANSDYGKGLEKTFTKIENALTRLQQKAASPVMSERMFDGLSNELNSVGISLGTLTGAIDELGKLSKQQKIELLSDSESANFLKAIKLVEDFIVKEKSFSAESKELIETRKKLAAEQEKYNKALEDQAVNQALLAKAQGKEADAKKALDSAQAQVDALEDQEKAAKELQVELERVNELYEKFHKDGADKRKKADFVTPDGETINYLAAKKAAKDAANNLPSQAMKDAAQNDLVQAQQEYNEAKKNLRTITNQVSSLELKTDKLDETIKRLKNSVSDLEAVSKSDNEAAKAEAFAKLRQEAEALGISLDGIGEDATDDNIVKLKTSLNEFVDGGLAKVDTELKNTKAGFDQINPSIQGTKDKVEDGKDAWIKYNEQVSNTNAMMSRIKQFIGMEGAITAMRAAVRNAMQSIKELDATMTEMAVVTDLGVGDYWNQLPEHTQRANQLGVAINDIYKAETLYYQQGLKTNEVTEMSAETLKMARVAGLSAEDATNKMTAALRGFNMELNETSAQRISDVYSELAAITASDVDEISSAMTKTASIASSAGMEFETTAAFLSQIIETTRESAETAGTALKTVIARFQELKKDPAEIGEVEGEVVDANKIEAALRSVDVALRDTNGQFRDLDDVFLELAGKWDTLDTNTQRYIATVAAGSRQQSRFIAMMSNYGRTQELVNAANNSAGASNQQFEKTLESLDAKLSQLKNAFNEFSMGIMNSELLKKGVDALTQLFNIVNNVSKGWNGLTGSLSKVGVIFSAIKIGEALVKKLVSNINTGITSMGTNLGNSIAQGVTEGMNRAKGIVTDAVDEMNGKVQSSQPVSAPQVTTGFIQQKLQQKTEGIKQAVIGFAQTKMPTQYKKITPVFGTEGLQKFAKETKMSLKDALTESVNNTSFDIKKFKKKLFPESLWDGVNKQFTKKMSEMGKSTDEISKAWTKVTGEATNTLDVIDGLDKELEKAFNADKNPKKDDDYKEIKANIEGLADEEKNLGEIRAQIATKGAAAYDKLTQGVMNCGIAATSVGVAFGAIGAYLEGMGLDEAAEGFTTLGNALTFVGGATSAVSGVLTVLKPIVLKAAAAMGSMTLACGAVGIAIAAVVAVVLLLINRFKEIQANSPEGKLKAATEAAEQAGEAADKASEAYNNLKTSIESLDSGYETLEDLTYGTEEWKEQVEKLNDEVKELLKTYPELAKYVTMEDGVLTLDTDAEGVETIMEDYQTAMVSAEAMSMGADLGKAQAQRNVYSQEIINDYAGSLESHKAELDNQVLGAIGGAGVTAGSFAAALYGLSALVNVIPVAGQVASIILAVGGTIAAAGSLMAGFWAEDQIETITASAELYHDQSKMLGQKAYAEREEIAKALADGILNIDENGEIVVTVSSEELAEQYNITAPLESINSFVDMLEGGAQALRNFGEELNTIDATRDVLTKQIGSLVYSNIDTTRYSQEDKGMINSYLANEDLVMQQYDKAYEKWSTLSKEDYAQLAEQEARKIFVNATDIKMDGDVLKYKLEGSDEYKEVTRDALEVQLAAKDSAEALTKLTKDLPKTVKSFSTSLRGTGEYFEKLFYGDKSLTSKEIQLFEGQFNADYYWEQMDEGMKALFDNDEQAWTDYFNGIVETSKKALNDFNNTMDDFKKQEPESTGGEYFKNKIRANVADRYNNLLEDLMSTAGISAASEFNDKINNFLDDQEFDTEEIEKFFSVINSEDFDIKNLDDWEDLPDLLADAGLEVDNTNDKFDIFIAQAGEAARAIEQVDLEKITEQIINLSKISSDIASGEQDRVMSEDVYKVLLDSGVVSESDFFKTLDNEYVYLGESMQELRQAIIENTKAILGKQVYENVLDYDRILKEVWARDYDEDNGKDNLEEYFRLSFDEQKGLLQQFLQQIKNSGGSLNYATKGMVDDEAYVDQVVATFDQDEMHTIFSNILMQLKTKAEDIVSMVVETETSRFQGFTFKENIAGIEEDIKNVYAAINEEVENFEVKQTDILTSMKTLAARMGTVLAQAAESGTSEATLRNLARQITLFNELAEQYESGKINLKEYEQQLRDWQEGYEEAENKIVTAMNSNNMAKNFEEMMTVLTDAAKQMENTFDFELLRSQMSGALEQFGIDAASFANEEISNMKTLILAAVSGGASGAEALMKIVEIAANQYGVNVAELSAMSAASTITSLSAAEMALLEFANMLVSLGLAQWTPNGEEIDEFVFNTAQAYQDIVDLFGNSPDNKDEDEIEYWESDYDWLYNYNEEINYLIREREKSEKAYQKALEDTTASAEDLYEATKEHLADLETLASTYTLGAQKAAESIKEMFNDPINAEFIKYVKFDASTNKIIIDDVGLSEANFTKEVGDNFKNFLSALERNKEEIEKAEEELENIEDDVEAIEDWEDEGREALADIYDDVKEGLVKERQDQLDAIRENTEAINEAEQALMDSIQKQIDEAREARDNEKTEKDLNSKRAKLAYLKRDTSGMYGLDILSLEKEIAEQEEQYTDQLIDQKLQDLQEASDEAIEQRNKQIELQEKEFEEWQESQAIWSEVERIVQESLNNEAGWDASEAERLSEVAKGNINPIREELEAEEENRKIKLAEEYLNGGLNFKSLKNDAIEVLGAENTKLAGIKNDLGVQGNGDIEGGGSSIMGGLNSINKWQEEKGVDKTALDGALDGFGNKLDIGGKLGSYFGENSPLFKTFSSIVTQLNAITKKVGVERTAEIGLSGLNATVTTPNGKTIVFPASSTISMETFAQSLVDEAFSSSSSSNTTPTTAGRNQPVGYLDSAKEITKDAVEKKIETIGGVKYVNVGGGIYYKLSDGQFKELKRQGKTIEYYKWPAKTPYYKFKTGGLADFTGPAWLDGTKSSPELVLNAKDTRNFIMLKDVLSDILSGTSTIKHSSNNESTKGDNYYEIEINVDSLSDDYDVDQLADKIKSMIYEDSIYRNVNTVNLLR